MSARARFTLSAGISISCSKRWRAGMKTLPKACSHLRRLSNAARLRSFLLVSVTPSTCLTTRNSSSARLCPSVSPQIPPTGACFFTAHSSIRSYERELAQQNNQLVGGLRRFFRRQVARCEQGSQRGAKQREQAGPDQSPSIMTL